jgi:hypothetical protein
MARELEEKTKLRFTQHRLRTGHCTITRLDLVDRELFITHLRTGYIYHIYHIQGVIVSKIPYLISLRGAVYCSPDIFILRYSVRKLGRHPTAVCECGLRESRGRSASRHPQGCLLPISALMYHIYTVPMPETRRLLSAAGFSPEHRRRHRPNAITALVKAINQRRCLSARFK